jgi:glycosyltransferase involved in cell wall biosynthesis
MIRQRRRVLHIGAGLNFGGVETHLRLIAEVNGKRFEHHFCGIDKDGPTAEAIRAADADVYVLGINPWPRKVAAVRTIHALLRRLKPDVVHCHGAEANVFGLPAAWLARVPLRIGEEIGFADRGRVARLVYGLAFRTAHCVVAVSDAAARKIRDSGEVRARKVVRIYNPVRLSQRLARPRLPEQPLRIGFLGRLEPEKNAQAIVRALSLLGAGVHCELLLIGDGIERGEIEALVRSSKLGSRVQIIGYSAQPDDLLSSCHVYVQPSLHEGMGIALVEAMSCGLPPIVSPAGGMPEIVKHGVNGWVLRSVSPADIADALREVLHMNPIDLARFGEQARASVQDQFDPRAYVAKLEQLYDKCLGRRRLAGVFGKLGQLA